MNVFGLLFSLALGLCGNQSVELVFAGDAMQHDKQLASAKRADGSYDYSNYFTALKPYIESADYAVVNLEVPLGGAPYSGYPMFCAPDSYLTAIKDAGFDFILGANNHSLDRRDKGVRRTIDQFDAQGIPYAGIYRNKTERDSIMPVIRNINGFRVAFLNYTYGTNGITIQDDVVVDYIDKGKIKADIKKAREAGAEIIAACMHWGVEYVLLPNSTQKQLADFLEEQGVELIIGGHPHVIQPMEMRRRKSDGRNVLVVYSLGNFISAMRKTDTQGGAMVRVRLSRDESGKAYVDTASYRLVFVSQPSGSDKEYKLVPAEQVLPAFRTIQSGFIRNARKIFDKHNINVPIDTTAISSYSHK